ncbi:tetratricopeptide repeat protein [Sansalvadorimonas sp. 2012CJ34-2]|uniref:Tetratricopeptide repeat protein n=1 Tax=Parendozoicomonas callyspongiae TaxID=2942213 RepID=A0ABT0PL50_9GAMM|nr:tetratricopeptide repeat protein [Sansalvadorimonas sp. 2012CJ34-2]MCL6271462.1 tetratricopeptide repeat protein [Sansalvadorimonas sp. 2012CJ34-2]
MVPSYNRATGIRGLALGTLCLFIQACSQLPVQEAPAETLVEKTPPVAEEKAGTAEVPADVNETLLRTAKNYSGLIQLYKNKLAGAKSIEDEDTFRFQLAKAYLESGDADSAIFYIDPVILSGRDSYELFLLKSRALLAKNDAGGALRTAITAHSYGVEDSEIYNQLGMVYARTGNYPRARVNFQKARQLMMDDSVVQNNLAVLDVLEEHYDAAADKLLSLYRTGQADERVRANLALALAKSGRYSEFVSIFGQGKGEEERLRLFSGLAGTKGTEQEQAAVNAAIH